MDEATYAGIKFRGNGRRKTPDISSGRERKERKKTPPLCGREGEFLFDI